MTTVKWYDNNYNINIKLKDLICVLIEFLELEILYFIENNISPIHFLNCYEKKNKKEYLDII